MPQWRRREFLKTGLVAAGAAWLTGRADGQPARPRVIHIQNGYAVSWPRDTSLYRSFVDQQRVDRMLDRAVVALTGLPVTPAWQSIFALGQNSSRTLAIKVNLNNSTDPVHGASNDIDALPHPAVAVVQGFVRAGGDPAHVTIYDATNTLPTRFAADWFRDHVHLHFPAVRFCAAGGGDSAPGEHLGTPYDPATHVTWRSGYAEPPPRTRVADVVLAADYLVNIPIVKRHCAANVTLGFKNHFGSIDRCDRLHPWVEQQTPGVSLLADLLDSPRQAGNPNLRSIAQKTVLTVGDLLYGQPCSNFGHPPRPWTIFRREWPASLIVADNVVAADSVMLDILEAEPAFDGDCGAMRTWTRSHLQVAEALGLGPHETIALPVGEPFDPARLNYGKIDFQSICAQAGGAALRLRSEQTGIRLEWTHPLGGPYQVHRSPSPDFQSYGVLTSTADPTYLDPAPPHPCFYRIVRTGA